MDVLATFLLGHLIGDFALQTDLVYSLKKQGSIGLLVHIGIHLGVTALLLKNTPQKWLALVALGLVHFTLDWFKLHSNDAKQAPGFLIDQLLHLGVILVIARLASGLKVVLPPEVLYPAVLYGLVSPIMMFLWIWTNDLDPQRVRDSKVITWVHKRMFWLSKRLGIPLLAGVLIGWFCAVMI